MSITQHFRPILKGAGIGLLVAAAALASGDSPDQAAARMFDILDKPVSFFVWAMQKAFGLSDASTVGLWLLFHFAYWILIGALAGWGVGILRSKLSGDDE